jgi:hypothetical protein
MPSKKIQRFVLGTVAAAAALAVSTGVAATASAEPIGPNGPAKKAGYCAVVNTDGNGNESVTYVPTGTRSGLTYCGADGEWHLGWLVDGLTVAPTGGVKGGANVAAAPVLTAAR